MAARYYPESFELNVSRGLVKGTSFIHKFGAVPAMSNGTEGTIWDINDTIYPWTAFDIANNIVVECGTNEVGGSVQVQGLDENFNLITEEISLDGQTGNTSSNIFKRVFRAYYIDPADLQNTANVDISINGTDIARIQAGRGQTLMCVYTIPAGHTGYLYHGSATAIDSAEGNMFVRYFGQANFRTGHAFTVSQGQYEYEFEFPIPIPEKSDIDIRTKMIAGNNSKIAAAFDLLLIKEGLE